PCPASCCRSSTRARSTASRRACPQESSRSARRTGRRRPLRWRRRSCGPGSGSPTTIRVRTSSPASPPPSSLPAAPTVVVNGDGPQIGSLPHALAYGVDDPSVARPSLQHAADSKYCIRCGAPYDYRAAYVGHLGDYRCPNCGHERPPLDVRATSLELNGLERAAFRLVTAEASAHVELALPGLYNVYNALGAATLCLALGVGLDEIAAGLGRFSAAFGRFERIPVADK